jgi:hypothetical protein
MLKNYDNYYIKAINMKKYILLILTLFTISSHIFADEDNSSRHRIGVAFDLNFYTNLTSYTSIHTGLSVQYSYRIKTFPISKNSDLSFHGGFKTGVMLEGGARFPLEFRLQALPVYIPLLPLLSVEYRKAFFHVELTIAGGGEMVLYKNISPYIQLLLNPHLDFTFDITKSFALELGMGWGWMGVLDYWSGPSMSIGTQISF